MPRAETTQSTETTEGPTAAERARTLAFGFADGVLIPPGVPDVPVPAYSTDRDGRPLLLVRTESPVLTALSAEAELPAALRISDVAPVALADRVRGRARLHGRLTEVPAGELRAAAVRLSRAHARPELLDLADERPGGEREWTILALEVAQVELDDAWGSAVLEPEEYAAAVPDPFVAVEAGILTHLDSHHRAELTGLLPASAPPGPVRPLGLDRHGMWLRHCTSSPEGPASYDLRLSFGGPVSDIHGLRCAYRRLFGRAARNDP